MRTPLKLEPKLELDECAMQCHAVDEALVVEILKLIAIATCAESQALNR